MNSHGIAIVDNLRAPGRYVYRASSPLFAEDVEHLVVITEAQPIARIQIVLTPAGALEVTFAETIGDAPISLKRAPIISAHQDETGDAYALRKATESFGIAATKVETQQIPQGEYTLRLRDTFTESEIEFQPIDPIEHVVFVAESRVTSARIEPVRRRAYVEIIGRHRGDGSIARNVNLRVRHSASGLLVRPLRSRGGTHFSDYLAPGEYGLEFRSDKGEVTRRQRIVVDREPISRTLAVTEN